MVTINLKAEGSALVLCMLLMLAMTAVFAGLHMRMHFFMQTMHEREQYLKVRAATNGLMSCALDKACKKWSALVKSNQQREQLTWPIDRELMAQATIEFQPRETPDGKVLNVAVALTHKQRVCNAHAVVQPVYHKKSGELLHYHVSEWCVG
jgi:type II secretory pathway component PulK